MMRLVILVSIVFRRFKYLMMLMGFNVPIFKGLNLFMVSLKVNRGNLVTLERIVGNLIMVLRFQRNR